ncbi:hypothetical protein MMC14_008034, partial [Varicellaria rhodocarpa]|nr:hypothetical protein [Varicellaria rhodocarpa]
MHSQGALITLVALLSTLGATAPVTPTPKTVILRLHFDDIPASPAKDEATDYPWEHKYAQFTPPFYNLEDKDAEKAPQSNVHDV